MAGHRFRPFGSDAIAVLPADESRHERSCFADEVVVDFPSMANAVDRIRSAFLADERPAPLSAEIRLSAVDARTGVVVPLDVPVRSACRHCEGRGESWTAACAHCAGSGIELVDHRLQIRVPAGVSDGAAFRFSVKSRHNIPTRIELRIHIE